MNLIRKIRLSLLPVMAVAFVMFSCEDTSKAPIVTFDSAGKGAYIKSFRADHTGGTLINILTQADFDASQFGFSVEFVDGSGGTRVTNYTLTVEYEDVNGSAGDLGPVTLASYDAASFTAAESGNLGVPNISVSGQSVAAALGLTYADLSPGDEFTVRGSITTDDGEVWTSSNSSAPVRGNAFQGWFDFAMPAGCPSNLAGTYDYVSTNNWCGGGQSGTITIIANGGGEYTFNDWSFGAYPTCYGGNAAGWGTLAFTDVCAVVSFTGFTDNYGDTWTFVSSISGNDWLIAWSNTYGESGETAITFPSGVPFTLN